MEILISLFFKVTIGFFVLVAIYFCFIEAKKVKENTPEGQREIQNIKDKQGNIWEAKVASDIKKYFGLTPYSSVLIPNKRAKQGKTECDLLFINNKGIFCVECKSKKKVIEAYVNLDSNSYWTFKTYEGAIDSSEKSYNPVNQNASHIRALREVLPANYKNIPIYNVVCTSYNTVVTYQGEEHGNNYSLLNSEKKLYIGDIKNLYSYSEMLIPVMTSSDIELLKNFIGFYVSTKEEMHEFKEKMFEEDLKRKGFL